MSDYIIPFDIQKEIMKRLPVKSLIQFRSVSKTWKSYIDSPEFIAAYTSQMNSLLVRYKDTVNIDEVKYISFIDDDSFPQHKFSPTVSELAKLLEDARVVGSSLGLFCFYGTSSDKQNVVLWNPSIRKSVGIDVPRAFDTSLKTTVVGFGVCPVTLDPKLVKITGSRSNIPWEVEIFTLSSGNWRIKSTNLPRGSVSVTWSQIAIDRFIYWAAFKICEYDSLNLIISFDMTSEEFGVVDLPGIIANQPPRTFSISKLRESLVVLQFTTNSWKQVFPIWVMNNGVPNSFTKLYTIYVPNASIKRVLGFRNSGAPIIEMDDNGKSYYVSDALSVFEPESGHISEIGVTGTEYSFFVSSYKETLLLLGQ